MAIDSGTIPLNQSRGVGERQSSRVGDGLNNAAKNFLWTLCGQLPARLVAGRWLDGRQGPENYRREAR